MNYNLYSRVTGFIKTVGIPEDHTKEDIISACDVGEHWVVIEDPFRGHEKSRYFLSHSYAPGTDTHYVLNLDYWSK